MDIEFVDWALDEAIATLQDEYGKRLDKSQAKLLISEYIGWLSSDERNFSDEMLQARKTFKKLTEEQPEECPSKLFEDALRSIGRM